MPRWLRRWSTPLLVLLLVGGNGAALQVTGWMGMLAARAPAMGFGAAMRTTFDGSSPCALCHAAQEVDGNGTASAPGDAKAPKDAVKPVKRETAVPDLVVMPTATAGERARWLSAVPTCRAQSRPLPEPPPPRAG